ncbi:hypothetical protein BX070DRAFT_219590 [Coemansia spiralis]|nr:hypothetical protein BX070DRAFT_219590 [Coemansia spiralis]
MAGSSDSKNDNSGGVSTFVSSLSFNVVIATIIFIVFITLRPHFKRVYAPRTYAVEKERRSQPISNGLFSWIPMILSVPDHEIIARVGLDTYMFLRYIRSMFVMFVALSLLSVVTILPANITGGNGATGMDKLTMGNVKPESKKLWVHIVFFMLFVAWVMWSIFGELRVYTRLRLWWLTNPEHAKKVGASTIMVSTLPHTLINDEDRIRTIFNVFPGGVRQVIVNRNCSDLEDIVEERDSFVKKLEKVLTNHAVKCEKEFNTATKKGKTFKEPKLPTMRESKIPLKGPKLDAVEYLSTKIAELNKKIAESGDDESKYKSQSTAFVLFNKQIAAHMASQTVLDYKPFSMNSVSLDIYPEDIIWGNLNLNPYDRRIRSYISFAATVGLVITWTLITGALTALVSVDKLKKLPGLSKMTGSPFFGLFTGVVPSAILAIAMILLPIVLRLLLRLEGTPRVSDINLRLLNRYFFFQVWNVYLVTIFTSSILSIATTAFNDPGIILTQIQTQVPASATPILTYVLLLAFTGAAKEILQGFSLVLRYVLPMILAKTPRALCEAEKPSQFDWATSIPTHSLIFLMGFSYSFISPIVNCFVAVYFGLFYLVYRYQFLYVYNDRNWVTGGLSFPISIKQTLVGVYISEIYMLLMMIAKVADSKGALANAILRIIFPAITLVLTILAHIYINDAYMPIINYLPVRGAVEIEENPDIATAFPDVTGDGDGDNATLMDSKAATTPEAEIRKRIYAMYGSLVPKKFIDYVLNKIPSLLHPHKKPGSNDDNSADDVAEEEANSEFRAENSAAAGNTATNEATSADSGFLPMPVAHHYSGMSGTAGDFYELESKRMSENTNVLSIDSNARAAAPTPVRSPSNAHAEELAISNPYDAQFSNSLHVPGDTGHSVHSFKSTTELRQRRMPTASLTAPAQRKSRYDMTDNQLLASSEDNALAEAFSNPALRAKPTCNIWVPLDNNGLCNELYSTVQRLGEGTIRIVTSNTSINEKCKVKADVEFNPDNAELGEGGIPLTK